MSTLRHCSWYPRQHRLDKRRCYPVAILCIHRRLKINQLMRKVHQNYWQFHSFNDCRLMSITRLLKVFPSGSNDFAPFWRPSSVARILRECFLGNGEKRDAATSVKLSTTGFKYVELLLIVGLPLPVSEPLNHHFNIILTGHSNNWHL